MYKIDYKASYDAIHIDQEHNQITLKTKDVLLIKANSKIVLDLPVDIILDEGWECNLFINPVLDDPPILVNPYVSSDYLHHIILYNPTNEDICYNKETELFKLMFYKQSIVLANVDYDKSTGKCTFGFDNLESSFVKIPVNHLTFTRL